MLFFYRSITCRFQGIDPEPRPGLSSGHIPHSLSLPFNTFLKKHSPAGGPEYTTFRPLDELERALVDTIGQEDTKLLIEGKRQTWTTCGSGMSAGVLWLGLKLLGLENVSLYDEVCLYDYL